MLRQRVRNTFQAEAEQSQMTRISLVYFDLHTGAYPGFHHGLAYIIGALRTRGHDVSLFHLKKEEDITESTRTIQYLAPKIIGLSFTSLQTQYVNPFLNAVKPCKSLIIAGGVHATLTREQMFDEFPELQGICVGEGEFPLLELSRRMTSGEDYLSVPGFYFQLPGRVLKNPIPDPPALDSLPFPDYSLFDYQNIITDSGGWLPIFLSRGCPYQCSYCCNHAIRKVYPNPSRYTRYPPIDHSMKIIRQSLSLESSVRKIKFADDTFTFNREWLKAFCSAYKAEINLPFICNARIETIDDDVASNLKDAGCIAVDLGVESGNEWLRKNVLNRNNTNQDIKTAFAILHKHDINCFAFAIVGLPFETAGMAEDTIRLIMELKPYYGKCSYFYPFPGTDLYKTCKQHDLVMPDYESHTNYLESPCLRETFMSHNTMRSYAEKLNVFFYFRLLLSKSRMPGAVENFIYRLLFMHRRVLLKFLNSNSQSSIIREKRSIMRKYALKYLR